MLVHNLDYTHAAPSLVTLSSGFASLLRKHPHNINHACAPRRSETRLPAAAAITQSRESPPAKAAHTCPVLRALSSFAFETPACFSAQDRRRVVWPGGLVKEAETSRPAPPQLIKKRGKSKPPGAVGRAKSTPRIPGVWVSVPSRGIPRCAVPVRRAGSRRLAQSEKPCGQTVTAADGLPGSIRDVRSGRGGGGEGARKPHQQQRLALLHCRYVVRARNPRDV